MTFLVVQVTSFTSLFWTLTRYALHTPVSLHYYKYLSVYHSSPLGSWRTRTMFLAGFCQTQVTQPNSKLLKHKGNTFAYVVDKTSWLQACLDPATSAMSSGPSLYVLCWLYYRALHGSLRLSCLCPLDSKKKIMLSASFDSERRSYYIEDT